jgi:primase-polymerase (primpol)-like protein
MIKETTGVITPTAENIPEALTERSQWVCWRLETRDGKPTKVPYIAGTNSRASSTDLMTWSSFEYALAAYEAGEPPYGGIGFVFCSADPFVGIDLDDCRNPESGEVAPWAQKIIDRVQEGYIEISPSGAGVHIIVEGTVRDGRTRKEVHEKGKRVGRVEMYGRAKFFTITGGLL